MLEQNEKNRPVKQYPEVCSSSKSRVGAQTRYCSKFVHAELHCDKKKCIISVTIVAAWLC